MSARLSVPRGATLAAPRTSSLARAVPVGSGKPLEPAIQTQMSAQFGHDFSKIRIHAEAPAAQQAAEAGARAYALGDDIIFGAGRYAPGSLETDRLLAHELTHVVQQARFGPGDPSRTSDRSDASEREADSLASQVMMGQAVRVQSTPGAALARDEDDQMCSADPSTEVCAAPPATGPNMSVAAPPDPDRVDVPGAGPASPVYPTYAQNAYGIMNSCDTPENTAQALVGAAQHDLGARGVPAYPVGQLAPGDTNLGSAYAGPNDWHFDVHNADFNTEQNGQARPLEDRADAANTVAHEGFHMYQGYEEARLVAGLGGDPTTVVPPAVAAQAAMNPILQSDAHTARVQEWYDDDHGAHQQQTEAIEADPGANHHAYCQLPVERDAWNAAAPVTNGIRQEAGAPMPDPAHDRALCE